MSKQAKQNKSNKSKSINQKQVKKDTGMPGEGAHACRIWMESVVHQTTAQHP